MSTQSTPVTWLVREIAAAVAHGDITASDIAEMVLERIHATEDRIQAFSQLDVALVKKQGEMLSAEASAGNLRGPLHGVPIAIKEWFDVEGFPTLLKGPDAPPEAKDSTIVGRLRAAGALIVGKTHVPIGATAPPTRNPWNLAHSPGGSSSGSAAAVAARVVPLAIGEQTGGSILRPAAFCGVGAIKPTYGALSRAGLYTGVWSRDHPGLIGLNMQDMALVLSVVGGYDPRDPRTIGWPAPSADLEVDTIRPPKIGVTRNFFPDLTDPMMLDAVDRSALRFADAGAEVVDALLPDEFAVAWDAVQMQEVERATAKAEHWAKGGPVTIDDLGPDPVAADGPSQRVGELIPGSYYLQSQRIRTWLSSLVVELLRKHQLDALLMAATPGPAPVGLHSTGSMRLLIPWSFLGFPAISVCAGLSDDGLPLGLQLVAAPREDQPLLRVGHWGEHVLGLLAPPDLARGTGA